MEKICLDREIILDFLRGDSNTVGKIRHYADEELCATSFTIFELLTTIKKPDVINSFVKNITPLDFNENCSFIASRIYNDSREIGPQKPINNIITASICIDSGAFLVTKDRKHYEKIRGLKLV